MTGGRVKRREALACDAAGALDVAARRLDDQAAGGGQAGGIAEMKSRGCGRDLLRGFRGV